MTLSRIVEVELQAPNLVDVVLLPTPGPGPDRVDAEVDVVIADIQVPQPGLYLLGGCLRQGKHPLLGLPPSAGNHKDRDTIMRSMGKHAVDELRCLVLFHGLFYWIRRRRCLISLQDTLSPNIPQRRSPPVGNPRFGGRSSANRGPHFAFAGLSERPATPSIWGIESFCSFPEIQTSGLA